MEITLLNENYKPLNDTWTRFSLFKSIYMKTEDTARPKISRNSRDNSLSRNRQVMLLCLLVRLVNYTVTGHDIAIKKGSN